MALTQALAVAVVAPVAAAAVAAVTPAAVAVRVAATHAEAAAAAAAAAAAVAAADAAVAIGLQCGMVYFDNGLWVRIWNREQQKSSYLYFFSKNLIRFEMRTSPREPRDKLRLTDVSFLFFLVQVTFEQCSSCPTLLTLVASLDISWLAGFAKWITFSTGCCESHS